MAISSQFTINGTAVSSGLVTVLPGAAITLAVTDTAGISSIVWTCTGTHSASVTTATITALITPSGAPSGATATFTMPTDTSGQAYVLKCLATDSYGVTSTTFGLIGTISESGQVPGAAGEELVRHPTQGWTDMLNSGLRGSPTAEYHATTTDATVTTAATISPPEDSDARIQAVAVGRGASSGSEIVVEMILNYKRVAAAAPAQVGVDRTEKTDEDGAWDVTHDVDGNTVRIRVTGDAAEDVDWHVYTYVWTVTF